MKFKDLPIGAYFCFADCMPSDPKEGISVFRKVVVGPDLLKEEFDKKLNIEHILDVRGGAVSSVGPGGEEKEVHQVFL